MVGARRACRYARRPMSYGSGVVPEMPRASGAARDLCAADLFVGARLMVQGRNWPVLLLFLY